jgi:glycosyltransferase involved in cell wall biosynthesis
MNIEAPHKPDLLVISHVLPFPGSSGQQQRVYYTLKTARDFFRVTIATPVIKSQEADLRRKLMDHCDQALLLPSAYRNSVILGALSRISGLVYSVRTGLKRSNYLIGKLEFAPERLESLLRAHHFDLVLFEYWHAADGARVFQRSCIPCALDMHDILWQAYKHQLESAVRAPSQLRRAMVERYRRREEQSWRKFDAVIGANREELEYVRSATPPTIKIFHAPNGVDLAQWPYSWSPSRPPRLAYYGGLGTRNNQADALACYHSLMPEIWRRFPDVELWIVGGNPPESIRGLESDSRVKVTGFVKNAQPVLSKMSLLLCPWSGTFGFRSRLIEVMALGVPVVASQDAVYGMELEPGRGLLLGRDYQEMIGHALRLLNNSDFAVQQSRFARQQIEQRFSAEATYGALMRELVEWLTARQKSQARESVRKETAD